MEYNVDDYLKKINLLIHKYTIQNNKPSFEESILEVNAKKLFNELNEDYLSASKILKAFSKSNNKLDDKRALNNFIYLYINVADMEKSNSKNEILYAYSSSRQYKEFNVLTKKRKNITKKDYEYFIEKIKDIITELKTRLSLRKKDLKNTNPKDSYKI